MIRWERAQLGMTVCGGCGASLPDGTPVQAIRLPGVTRVKYRGECCAGHAPPDLPAHIETREPMPTTIRTFDFSRARSAIREQRVPREWLPHPDD